MKRFIFLLALLFLGAGGASAMIDPLYKEAMQRGYPIYGDSVMLPDSSKCLLIEFNEGLCGKEFFDLPYCVKEGSYVWDEDACCEGLRPYLPRGVSGQSTCQQQSKIDFHEMIKDPKLWLGILAFNAVVFGSLFLIRRLIRR